MSQSSDVCSKKGNEGGSKQPDLKNWFPPRPSPNSSALQADSRLTGNRCSRRLSETRGGSRAPPETHMRDPESLPESPGASLVFLVVLNNYCEIIRQESNVCSSEANQCNLKGTSVKNCFPFDQALPVQRYRLNDSQARIPEAPRDSQRLVQSP